ncbi:hypothetical protein RAZWK3B_06017 [Roseobacter sp. AzwK-3b]|jgi:hypothetical protein|uniref:hypothetical protein n=1 Tax=Roseobacter sp. AzwK-3b TaxID=351016 RepID=UPI000156ACBC|nr:hypothetical protein [Roseobacter sp. AzwK-3b]EDM69544.1 hypothetical protein RAZWK3B_06017 [Roseobacter sp. AzwK-3b]
MDGQTVDTDRRTAEALRQQDVYEKAMASLKLERRKSEAMGYAVMASLDSFTPASRGEGWLGRAVFWSKIGCITFVCVAPNYLVWRLLL